MPLRKTASLRTNSRERHNRDVARKKAIGVFGASRVKGKSVHHKNGNNTDNRPSNLKVSTLGSHGKKHGRGNGKRGKK